MDPEVAGSKPVIHPTFIPQPKFLVQRDPHFRASGSALPGLAGRNPSGIPVPAVVDDSGVVGSGFPAPRTLGGRLAPSSSTIRSVPAVFACAAAEIKAATLSPPASTTGTSHIRGS